MVAKQLPSENRRKRANKNPHMTPKDEAKVLQVLEKIKDGQIGEKLSWVNLAKLTGWERHTLAKRPEILEAFKQTQEHFRLQTKKSKHPKKAREPMVAWLNDELLLAHAQIKELKKVIADYHLELIKVRKNAMARGLNAQGLDQPKPKRKV